MTAARVRKARWPTTVACGHHVNVGDVIVRRGGKWTCRPCAIAVVRAAPYTTEPKETP